MQCASGGGEHRNLPQGTDSGEADHCHAGTFGTELNEALIRQYDIGVLVTKESGQAGGFPEKIRAAEHTKIPVVMIQNPEQAGG